MNNFSERFPWIGADLQTLRDTLRTEKIPLENSRSLEVEVPSMPGIKNTSGKILTLLNLPDKQENICGVVVLLHGLGGSSERQGLKRMAYALLKNGFAVLRVNLRGANPGRSLAPGTYAANCNSDIIPVLIKAKEICNQLSNGSSLRKVGYPLFGVGISLGGTILLNSCREGNILDGLACTSSPLDLAECSASIERKRNRVYQSWLLKRLVKQTLADPIGLENKKKEELIKSFSRNISKNSIREFDSIITAPRWGYKDVDEYYSKASPANFLINSELNLPPTLILHASDDPWVPAKTINMLIKNNIQISKNIEIVITKNGGHNGFHSPNGCWGDQLVIKWLKSLRNKLELNKQFN